MRGQRDDARGNNKPIVVFGFFLLFLALCFGIAQTRITLNYLDLKRHGVQVNAVVVSHEMDSTSGTPSTQRGSSAPILYTLVLHYPVSRDGAPPIERTWEPTVDKDTFQHVKAGDNLPIIYSQRHPQNVQLGRTPHFTFLSGTICLLCMLIGVLMVWGQQRVRELLHSSFMNSPLGQSC